MSPAARRIAARRTERLKAALVAGDLTWAELCREFGCSRRMLAAIKRMLDSGTGGNTSALGGET